MKDIKIVCGSNWGDEGKGLMTDYFSQKPNSIVVCSNGGAQRGHTVTTPDRIRHVFHHLDLEHSIMQVHIYLRILLLIQLFLSRNMMN